MTLEDFIDLYTEGPGMKDVLHLASADRKEKLAKVLAEPFNPDIHYTLAYIHLHYAMLDEAEAILDHTPDKEDETYRQLEDYLNALKECQHCNIGIFPLTVRYRDWWNGPHLPFPPEFNGKPLDSWFPVRLDCFEKDNAYFTCAKREAVEIVYGTDVAIPAAEVSGKTDSMGEIAFYGDSYLIQFHPDGPWIQPSELNAVRVRAWPFIQRSHDALCEAIEKEYYS